MVCLEFRDAAALQDEAKDGAAMGFTGKQVIHPGQVGIVNEAFSPSSDQVQWAVRILEAYKQHSAQGRGTFEMDGTVVDMPGSLSAGC